MQDPITLQDLRDIVEHTGGWPAQSKVTPKSRKELGQMDCEPGSITVHRT